MYVRALGLLDPAPVRRRAAILGPAPAAGPSGNCSHRSAPSSRGSFALCSRAPQAATPVGTRPGAAPAPRSLPLPFTSQLPRSWKVGAGGRHKSNSVLGTRVWVPRWSCHHPGCQVERGLGQHSKLGGGGLSGRPSSTPSPHTHPRTIYFRASY